MQPASGNQVCVGPGPGPGSRSPPVTLPPVPLWAVPAGLRLTAVREAGLFVQSSLTVSKSLPGALVPNENVASLIPATPHPPWSSGLPLPSPAPSSPPRCPAHRERLHLTLLHLQLPPFLLLFFLPAPLAPTPPVGSVLWAWGGEGGALKPSSPGEQQGDNHVGSHTSLVSRLITPERLMSQDAY